MNRGSQHLHHRSKKSFALGATLHILKSLSSGVLLVPGLVLLGGEWDDSEACHMEVQGEV
jgi:hypothetical protein